MESYSKKYFGMTMPEFIKKFNEVEQKEFESGVQRAQMEALWCAAKNTEDTFVEDSLEFLEEFKEYLKWERYMYIKSAIKAIKDFLKEKLNKNELSDYVNSSKIQPKSDEITQTY